MLGRHSAATKGHAMGEVSRYPHGTFCWVDLGTSDVAGATAFYGGLLGWESEDRGGYRLCRLGGREVAGIHAHEPDQGVGWGCSIAVDDLEAATERARKLGARVVTEPTEVPPSGRTSAIADPTGAVVSLWQAGTEIGARVVNDVGAWSWSELVTPDLDAARAFYAGLFGWTAEENPGPTPRTSFRLGRLLIGGAHAPNPGEGDSPRWTVAFRVADVDQAVADAGRLGGSVLLAPMDIPIGRMAILADPAGAAFTVTAFPGPWGGVDGS
jgi:predicted enzyme related to lactoylglutathione lyase